MNIPVEELNSMLLHWANTPANGYLGSSNGGRDAARALLQAMIKPADVIKLLEKEVQAFEGHVVSARATASSETQAVLTIALTDGKEASASFSI